MILVQVKNDVGETREYRAHKLIFDDNTGHIILMMPAYIVVRKDGHDAHIEHGVVRKVCLISNIEWMSCDYVPGQAEEVACGT